MRIPSNYCNYWEKSLTCVGSEEKIGTCRSLKFQPPSVFLITIRLGALRVTDSRNVDA